MCKKLIYLSSFVLVLSLVGNAGGQDGTGLRGEYFHWSGAAPPNRETVAFIDLVLTRIDAEIDFYWNPGPDPPPGLNTDNFSVRWEGYIKAEYSEPYTFITGSDDGVRLWVNGQLIIDNWTDHDRMEDTSDPMDLVAGQTYPIVLEGYEAGGEAEWQLYWQSPSTPRGIVPQRVLYPLVKRVDYLASEPVPADGAVLRETWVSVEWTAGAGAISHDLYFGDNFDDVDAGTGDTFRGNQPTTNFIVGFPGFPYPEGLVPGTTYYWRIDEVNDLNPDSPWKGPIWSFMIAPKTAFNPNPADGGESVDPNGALRWEPGFGAKLHYVYFGDNFDDVNNAMGAPPTGLTTYTPGPLELAKVYYWRVDEFDAVTTHKGDVWSFTTLGAVGSPKPPNGATGVNMMTTLSWEPGDNAASHQVYFGTDRAAVRNATTASPEYKGTRDLGSESYDPGKLAWYSTYYWRVDEVNNVHPDSPWKGNVWSFTTGDFLTVDDFEAYNDLDPSDPASNRIFLTWMDGYDTPTNGSQVGYTDLPFCEQGIVHSGSQSMPLFYNNSGPAYYSEATLPLTYPRDWTEEGVKILTLWFYGDLVNVAEPMYVAVANATGPAAVVYHDNPDAVTKSGWTQWNIDLEEISNAGVSLTDVDWFAIGFGDRNNPQIGGSGKVYVDDIRLYRPAPAPEPEPEPEPEAP